MFAFTALSTEVILMMATCYGNIHTPAYSYFLLKKNTVPYVCTVCESMCAPHEIIFAEVTLLR